MRLNWFQPAPPYLGQVRLKLVEDGRAEAARAVAHDARHHAAAAVALHAHLVIAAQVEFESKV